MIDFSKEKLLELSQDKLVVLEDKKVRRIFHKGEWYFSITGTLFQLIQPLPLLGPFKQSMQWNKLCF